MQPKRTVQPETKHCFRGNVDFFASRYDLRAGSGTRARDCANGRAFSAACNRADDCAECGSATHKFACAFIASDAIAAVLQFLIRRAHAVAPPSDRDGFNV